MWHHIKEFRNKAFALFFLTFILWDIHYLNIAMTDGMLGRLGGILPQEIFTLPSLLYWAFLHSDGHHLISNTFGLLIFGSIFLLRDKISTFYKLTVLLAITTGLMVWTFGHEGIHLGFSGVVFGYFSYVLTRGFFNRDKWSILIAIVVAFLYGGMVSGVLPGQPGVSWESHLFGFINGIIFSYIINRRKKRKKRRFKKQF